MDLHEEAGKENEQTLANLSRSEEATSKDEIEIEKYLHEQKSKNTQYKTKSDLNAWKKFCESLKESRAIENIPANELDILLPKFFISVRKQNGTEYEPGTLSGFQFFDTNKKVSNHSVKDQCSTTSRSRRSAKLRCTAKRSQKFEKPRQLPFSISEATARNFCYHES